MTLAHTSCSNSFLVETFLIEMTRWRYVTKTKTEFGKLRPNTWVSPVVAANLVRTNTD